MEGTALVGPAGLADQHALARGRGARALQHRLHIGQRLLARTALPERIAVGHDDVAGGGDARVLFEQEIGVDVTHRHAGKRLLHPLDVRDELFLAHVLAQQHLVAHRDDVGVARPRHGNDAGHLTVVDRRVGAEPDTDQRLQTHLLRDARGLLVAVGAGEAAHPARVRTHDGQPLADLRFADLRPRRLALDVGAEAQAVDAVRQRGTKGLVQPRTLGPRQRHRHRRGRVAAGHERRRAAGMHGAAGGERRCPGLRSTVGRRAGSGMVCLRAHRVRLQSRSAALAGQLRRSDSCPGSQGITPGPRGGTGP